MKSDFEVLVEVRGMLNQVTDALEECAHHMKTSIELMEEYPEAYAESQTKKYFDLVEQARNV